MKRVLHTTTAVFVAVIIIAGSASARPRAVGAAYQTALTNTSLSLFQVTDGSFRTICATR